MLGVGKTSSLVEAIRKGDRCLEKPIDELLIVYTQNQPAYHELADYVTTLKLHRLESQKHLAMGRFLELFGENRKTTKAVLFDDVHLSAPPPNKKRKTRGNGFAESGL